MSAVENDGTRMVSALCSAGFTVVGQRSGQYVRLAWPGRDQRDSTLKVPVGDEYADYTDLLAEVRAELEYAARRGEAAQRALDLHAGEVPS
ncbi:hypothetical protein ABT336_13145 [Micromonospora sp. NPDC000207]|uniref:hypothetical protein n=1 Tax=Micromonospora sp. NPDC000207 TaxID=3154246 RepID=UPI0033271BFA